MYKRIVLSVVLYRTSTVNAAGCFPQWISGGAYNKGSVVSQSITTNTTGVLVTTTNNYECISGDGVYTHTTHCPLYDPVGTTTSSAWKDLGVCTGTAAPTTTTVAPTLAAWSGVGCPDEWAAGSTYNPGQVAALNGIVYKCSEVQSENQWCGIQEYKPGDSQYWEVAWTRLGSCSGTMSSTTPNHSGLPDTGGCPDEFDALATYHEGDTVQVHGIVLKCRSWPNSLYCSYPGYEPLGFYSEVAWTKVGFCSGAIPPPTPSNIGCPEEYSASNQYGASDMVSVDLAEVYQCAADIHNAKFCSQYKPGELSGLGWTFIGNCNGTVVPTDPFADLQEVVGACPAVYDASTKYEGEDFVSVEDPATTSKRFVYQCKLWSNGGAYCNSGSDFAPGTDNGDLGWTVKGWCDTTVTTTTTTSAPFAGCNWLNGTSLVNINPWSESELVTYNAGTRVRVENRVYMCKGYPYYLWCRSVGYKPENSLYWGEAWTAAGTCEVLTTTTTTAAPTTTTSTTATTTTTITTL